MNPVNVIAALASFWIPGLGQLIQGRLHAFIGCIILTIALWCIMLGWIMHFLACFDAAIYTPPEPPSPGPSPPVSL